jgi:hypothetical protein
MTCWTSIADSSQATWLSVPWVYPSEIFPLATRSRGNAFGIVGESFSSHANRVDYTDDQPVQAGVWAVAPFPWPHLPCSRHLAHKGFTFMLCSISLLLPWFIAFIQKRVAELWKR